MFRSIAKISEPLYPRGALLHPKQSVISLHFWSRLISSLSHKLDVQVSDAPQDINLKESISNQNDVSLSLAKQLMTSKQSRESNLVFSPLSIQLALSLLAAGAKGATEAQLLNFLKCKSTQELNSLSSHLISYVLADNRSFGGPILSCANGVWVDQSLTLKPSFKQVASHVHKAAAYEVDFQMKPDNARNEVNSWVEKRTNSLIKDLLPLGSVDSMTRLVIANALYFKGKWEKAFDASKTNEGTFHLINGETIQVPYMTTKSLEKRHYASWHDGFKVLRLPFKKGKGKRIFSMCIFLPDARDGLYALVDRVCSKPNFIDCHLPRYTLEVGDFKIPKFKIDFDFEASELVQRLGLVSPFKDEGLTEIVDGPLFVSSIIHKAFIEVNEKGAEAAAATRGAQLVSVRLSMPFVADHPFFFIIREDTTGSVVFMGNVLNPSIS